MDVLIDNVWHAYEDLPVLHGVSLDIQSAEIVCILGSSGCGKSTLLRLIAGLEVPSAGHISTRGTPSPRTLHPIAFVFQDFALVPWRSVARNVELPLEHHALPKPDRRQRVSSALYRVKLSEFAQTYPNQLSGGMRQRTGLARALVVNPAVLLLDEPFSAVDLGTRELLQREFLRLWEEARFTAIYVTHDVFEATQMAHRVVILSRRPARVQKIIEIDLPHADRSEEHPRLVAMRETIRETIRGEIDAAGQELVDAP
ncbi:ABC transporter ATP-binding protein [Microvirga yunnanensis]|uniref:ABC transporter ATP-binding protein n=1 Tax=Microvirga yunnanensis TaxID=2953740 RepID=UPI0021CA1A3D|nr:ABC transporter ATP-binding protein [Microvirga sp. HBU65207]